MSNLASSAVWQCEIIQDRNELCVLLALADWSDDEGYSWPSLKQLSKKSRMTKQGVINVLQRMRGKWVDWDENTGGRGQRNRYNLLLENLTKRVNPVDSLEQERVNTVDSKSTPKGSTPLTVSGDKRVNERAEKGSTPLTRNNTSLEPSGISNPNPSANNEPSADLTGGEAREKKMKRPTVEELQEVFEERLLSCPVRYDPETEARKFFNHYESNGWRVGGRSPMKSWTHSVTNWIERIKESSHGKHAQNGGNKRSADPTDKERGAGRRSGKWDHLLVRRAPGAGEGVAGGQETGGGSASLHGGSPDTQLRLVS